MVCFVASGPIGGPATNDEDRIPWMGDTPKLFSERRVGGVGLCRVISES